MDLKQIKISGHRQLVNTDWVLVRGRENIIAGHPDSGGEAFLKCLQAINPPAIHSPPPFDDFLTYREVNGVKKKVLPHKKTAVFTVFICDEELRKKLVEIDQIFYETDRIEVGRRLDGSRWITFVEISDYSRWSEIEQSMNKLRRTADNEGLTDISEDFDKITHGVLPTTRIKGEITRTLENWLLDLEMHLGSKTLGTWKDTIYKVRRSKRFDKARKVVSKHLPVFIYFSDDFLFPSKLELIPQDFSATQEQIVSPEKLPEKYISLLLKDQKAENVAIQFQNFLEKLDIKSIPEIKLSLDEESLELFSIDKAGIETSFDNCQYELRWLFSLFVVLAVQILPSGKKAILLLENPAENEPPVKQKQFRSILQKLSIKYKLILTTSSIHILDKDRLKNVKLITPPDPERGSVIKEEVDIDDLESTLK